ncbi:viperin family antiviral radical SAM protein [Shewanella acanthi]|uniref:viperin family antiviral radical SAM protein n=1 Tax=Shewanella acanthi TaxID=2864212 RepID=UPI001C6612CB|nr:viperin family antiviral radical SAM protein [Shewanella acanthi]QYJ77911.1 viperin family antiviral radical SAM protein [Shewanella acanthi]
MKSNNNQLVINWHLTELCNYECQYCYAKWSDSDYRKNIIIEPHSRTRLLDELYAFFRPDNPNTPLMPQLSWSRVRLNFAGGEPLIYDKWLPDSASQASSLGMDVSLITNGSRLGRSAFKRLLPFLTTLGVSIDSACDQTNNLIGRKSRLGSPMDVSQICEQLIETKKAYPRLQLKINTVVSSLNYHEDLTDLITDLSPAKWKVLKMLPVVDDKLTITDAQFCQFISRHKALSSIMYPENGTDMRESYIMIDPYGRFYQNVPDGIGYQYSASILEVGVEQAFRQLTFNSQRFENRYLALNQRVKYEV